MLLSVSACSCISVTETENFQSVYSKQLIIHKVGLKNNDIDRKRNKNSEQNENTDENVLQRFLYDAHKNYHHKNSDFYARYSEKFGIAFDGTENRDLLMTADEWLGTGYRLGGESKSGIDCSALVQVICKKVFGVKISRTVSEIFKKDLKPVEIESLQPGDILCFKSKGRKISHIGMYLKDEKFVHASRKRGVSINALSENYYRKRFAFAGRVAGSRSVKKTITSQFGK
jgi:cell wall-associated NlpC family hydrolase